jgi:cystathionine gamma-lyase
MDMGMLSQEHWQSDLIDSQEEYQQKSYKYFQSAFRQDPAQTALEKNIACLENGRYALAFSSGLATCCALTKLLRPGDHILVGEDIYGGAYHLIENILSQYEINVSYINTSNSAEVEKAIRKNTKMLWLESPSNPLLRVADVEALAALAKKHKIITVVDNTSATPCFQKPLALGADIVVHSSAKYLSGRTDIVAGAVATNRLDLFEELQSHRQALADTIEPIDCFCILKGMRNLSDRMCRQEKSAKKIANFLSTHKSVQAVYYPGLPSHKQYDLACKQMNGFGSMLAFELKGGSEAATGLLREVQVFALSEKIDHDRSVTDEPSMICSTISHAKFPQRVLEKDNFYTAETLVRLTIGLENVDDLINDLAIALQAVDHKLIEFPAVPDLRDCI